MPEPFQFGGLGSSASRRPTLGVIGLNHGYALAQSARACRAVQLIGACTRNPERHKEKAERLNLRLFNDVDSMLLELQLDGVLIAAPTHQLVRLAKTCIQANVGVLVEKPLGISVSEAQELKRAAAATTAKVLVGYYRRAARQVSALKSALAEQIIGDVLGFSCRWVIQKSRDYFKDWKGSRALGGGCLMINAIHDIDMLQHLFGPIETVAALQSDSHPTGDVEHFITITMKFAQGLVGTAVFADQSPSPYAYDTTVSAVSKFPTYPEDSYHFFGTRGSLAFPSFTVYSNSTAASSWYDLLSTAAVSDVNNTVDDPISREIEHFAQVLSGKEPPHATVDDAIRNLAVVEAIRRSLQLSTVEPVRLSGD